MAKQAWIEKLKNARVGEWTPIEFIIGDKKFVGTVRCTPLE